MTATATPDTKKGSIGAGIFLIVLGLATVGLFGFGAEGGLDSRFVIDEKDAAIDLPELVLPSRATAFILALLCFGCAAWVLTRGASRGRTIVVSFAIGFFVFAFLVWAVRGDDMNLLGMLQSSLL